MAQISGQYTLHLIYCPLTHDADKEPAKEASALISWLGDTRFSNPETMHFDISENQEPDTCTWMVESRLWREWLQGDSVSVDGCRRFMWIHGLPGTGKTILASFLIDNLLDKLSLDRFGPGKSAKGFSYYYCHQQHDRDEALPFLRWVVRDLCRQLIPPMCQGEQSCEQPSEQSSRSIPEQLRQMWQRKQLSIKSLMQCLEALVDRFHSQYNKRVYIIVDAIDESKAPRDKFLSILTTIGTAKNWANVSLLITSRQYQDIKESIENLPRIPLPTVALAFRPSLTQQSSLFASASGNHQGPSKSPRQSSPSKRPQTPIFELPTDGGFDPMVVSPSRMYRSPGKRGPSSDTSASSKDASPSKRPQTPNSGWPTIGGFDQLAMSEQDYRSPGKRGCPSDTSDSPSDTSPSTKRRLQDTDVSPCTSLSMANPHVEKAIGVYVERRLERSERFKHWPRAEFLGELRRALAAKAAGIFRTVSCHLDIIDYYDLTEESKILDCINKMPDGIFETYEQMLVTLVPDGGDATREDREFARTALALMCSDTSNIPDADVLIAASRTTLPQLEAQFYTRRKLRKLLGCLVKRTPDSRPRTIFTRRDEDHPPAPLFSIAHFTVKEFLYSPMAANGAARYFAVSAETNQLLELRIVFDGLCHFDTTRGTPTRYEEYCLEMTDKALSLRPVIVENDSKLQNAVLKCLRFNAPHRTWYTTGNKANSGVVRLFRQHFPTWYALSPFEKDGAPTQPETSVLVNLLLLQWPELASKYLGTLDARKKGLVWCDSFKLTVQHSKSLPQTTLVHMCVSRRRLDFLKIFTANGVHFQDSRDDVLFRALSDPYDRDDAHGLTTLAILKELLEHGADPNPQGFMVTPLQVATHYLERNWVYQLLSSAANVHAVGDTTGVDPLPPTDDSCARNWYGRKPLKICLTRALSEKLTVGMQQGTNRVIMRYLDDEVIVVD